jgi:phage gp36-like protein
VNIKNGKVYCEDGAVYSLEELKIMDNAKQEITPGVHLVKKIFGGEIIKFIRKENQL